MPQDGQRGHVVLAVLAQQQLQQALHERRADRRFGCKQPLQRQRGFVGQGF